MPQRDATTPGGRLRTSDALLLAAGAVFWPWNVVAQNIVDFVRPLRVIVFVLLVFLVALAVASTSVRLGVRRTTAVSVVFLGQVLFMIGGRFFRTFGPALGVAVVVALLVACSIILSRIDNDVLPRALTTGLAIALISGPAFVTAGSLLGRDGDEVSRSTVEASVGGLRTTPDVFLLLLDGYPGRRAWALDFPDNAPVIFDSLSARGFDVPLSSWSPYWSTTLAFPALLDMGYPADVAPIDGVNVRELYEVISGENALVRVLDNNGYEVTYIGSGWSGFRCGSRVDRCQEAPLLDEFLAFVLRDTILGAPLANRVGHAFSSGAVGAMERLDSEVQRASEDPGPQVVVAHIVAPHPPPFITERCEVEVTPERISVAAGPWGVPMELWEPPYLEQVACVDRFVAELADRIPADSITVVVSDHGTDRRGQSRPEVSWSDESVIERLNILVAVRAGSDCSVGDPVVLPNVLRRVLSCLTEEPIHDLADRLFVGNSEELAEADVGKLLSMDPQ